MRSSGVAKNVFPREMIVAEKSSEKLERMLWGTESSSSSADICLSPKPSETAVEGASKVCSFCHETLPLDSFYINSTNRTDGRQSRCKKCFDLYRAARKRCPEDSVSSDGQAEVQSDCLDSFRITENLRPDSLYIMENLRIPGEVKIGRSQNPEERAKQLAAGNNFRVVVQRSYGEKGFLEKTLHQKLKKRRVEEGAGLEWFRISVEEADLLIRAAILEDNLSKL
jgi:hypothetical protein